MLGGLHVFCAVLAFSRVRFVRFAADERAATTLSLLAECFETLGGVPKVVLADRMACLKAGVVADRVVPAPDYVRFASHYRFRPDFCQGGDPESKGIVENLVGYAKRDLMIGCGLVERDGPVDLAVANTAAIGWCAEVNNVVHSEVAAIPSQRLPEAELELLAGLPSLRPRIAGPAVLRKVDRLSCVRFGSARYSGAVPRSQQQPGLSRGEGLARSSGADEPWSFAGHCSCPAAAVSDQVGGCGVEPRSPWPFGDVRVSASHGRSRRNARVPVGGRRVVESGARE